MALPPPDNEYIINMSRQGTGDCLQFEWASRYSPGKHIKIYVAEGNNTNNNIELDFYGSGTASDPQIYSTNCSNSGTYYYYTKLTGTTTPLIAMFDFSGGDYRPPTQLTMSRPYGVSTSGYMPTYFSETVDGWTNVVSFQENPVDASAQHFLGSVICDSGKYYYAYDTPSYFLVGDHYITADVDGISQDQLDATYGATYHYSETNYQSFIPPELVSLKTADPDSSTFVVEYKIQESGTSASDVLQDHLCWLRLQGTIDDIPDSTSVWDTITLIDSNNSYRNILQYLYASDSPPVLNYYFSTALDLTAYKNFRILKRYDDSGSTGSSGSSDLVPSTSSDIIIVPPYVDPTITRDVNYGDTDRLVHWNISWDTDQLFDQNGNEVRTVDARLEYRLDGDTVWHPARYYRPYYTFDEVVYKTYFQYVPPIYSARVPTSELGYVYDPDQRYYYRIVITEEITDPYRSTLHYYEDVLWTNQWDYVFNVPTWSAGYPQLTADQKGVEMSGDDNLYGSYYGQIIDHGFYRNSVVSTNTGSFPTPTDPGINNIFTETDYPPVGNTYMYFLYTDYMFSEDPYLIKRVRKSSVGAEIFVPGPTYRETIISGSLTVGGRDLSEYIVSTRIRLSSEETDELELNLVYNSITANIPEGTPIRMVLPNYVFEGFVDNGKTEMNIACLPDGTFHILDQYRSESVLVMRPIDTKKFNTMYRVGHPNNITTLSKRDQNVVSIRVRREDSLLKNKMIYSNGSINDVIPLSKKEPHPVNIVFHPGFSTVNTKKFGGSGKGKSWKPISDIIHESLLSDRYVKVVDQSGRIHFLNPSGDREGAIITIDDMIGFKFSEKYYTVDIDPRTFPYGLGTVIRFSDRIQSEYSLYGEYYISEEVYEYGNKYSHTISIRPLN